MQKFTTFTSIAVPLKRANIDTDSIIPKQFLKSIKRSGFGANLFDEWRYLDHGEIGMDNSKRPLNMNFVLNQAKYQDAKILLVLKNFGCGSSREHAPWALEDYGFKTIIAPSFADIFYNNCFKNGILPIVQNNNVMDKLFSSTDKITINLDTQSINLNNNTYHFEIDIERKIRLINGLDDISLTLQYINDIKAFEKHYFNKYNWL
ncbi:MAG: 3-isopropylmalate dehydratase small subunit [Candidatus Vesicomyosocius endoextente]|uniref:3-isopropylmalate dehydratase small subunit n=1 Tax=Candidatus Vesicomyosocius endoextente TaxID=2738853 RepID=A0A853G1T3_9GAMM|nr:3-isopropylmalate dehydratase small subunit [Candidatus Vesicomyosocius endoextente]